MTNNRRLRLFFWILALVLLVSMLLISRDAGISGDEEVHYKHSELVYDYFASHGANKSALNTPETHLQYYGQSFDNLVTLLVHAFKIEDVYAFRHLASSFAGWLTIVVTALFAAWISGYGAALVVLFLFAVSPTFLGHAQNNLKDIPFALAYIASVFYSLKYVFSESKPSGKTIFLLILSLAFALGIRAGGLLVFLYFGFFFILKAGLDIQKQKSLPGRIWVKQLLAVSGIIVTAYFLALITWPFALESPFVHVWKSYEVMARFPTTVRQIFEGRFDWSDYHPWYYLPKYMAITIPLVIFSGILLFFANTRKSFGSRKQLQLALLGFTILFPITFVVLKQSNLYGAWRHFLFVYPGIVLISALGIHTFFVRFRQRIVQVPAVVLLLLLSVHPLKFMVANYPYFYLYYNPFTGGLKGAYGNFETDYYYQTIREGSEWLQEYLKEKSRKDSVIVGGNFPTNWFFRNDKNIKCEYFPYSWRSRYDWDYAVVANSYIAPYLLKNKMWPPGNTIHTIFADGIPICAVLERRTKDDLRGIQAFNAGNYDRAVVLLQNAEVVDPDNELICFSLAEALFQLGENRQAEQALQQCLGINPYYEPALILSGDQALLKHDPHKAAGFYEETLRINRKQLRVYPKLAGIYAATDPVRARKLLQLCLKIDPYYKPALRSLADIYRKTSPGKAQRIDELINKLNNSNKN
jgi:tetratricopeptide (TPR) repeat protein